MSVAPDASGAVGRQGLPEVRDLAREAPSTVTWSVDANGTLGYEGPARAVLGSTSDADIVGELETVLAPILLVLRSDTSWDDYQLERTHEAADGPRRLLIHCRRRSGAGGGHVGTVMSVADQQQVEENLGDLIDRYRLLVEISPDGIVVHESGIVRYVNPTGLAWMAAERPSDMVGKPLSDFVAASSFGPLLERIAQMDHPGDVSRPTDMTIVTLDGRRLLLEAQSARTTWDGKPAFQVFMRDHSERRRAEAAVRYQANLLASVSDAVLATDLDGRITGWNPAAAALYRLAAPDALDRQVATVLGEGALRAGGGIRPGEAQHLRADGSAVAVHVAVAPLRDDHGQLCGEVAVCADQTYRLLAAEERRLAESRFTTVVTTLSEGIIVMASDGTVSSVNPAGEALLGNGVGEGANLLEILGRLALIDGQGQPLPAGQDPVGLVLATGSAQHDRVFGFDDRGGRHWWSMSCEPLERRADGATASIVCSITDVTERRASERRLTRAAFYDSLTGLANRTQLLEVLGRCVQSGTEAAVLFVDLDRFKAVNDTIGHLVGDQVLRTVAARVRAAVAPSGTVGRLAGDEFVVILPESGKAAAVGVAEVILERIAQPIRVVDQREVGVTASIGIATTGANETSAEALLGDADMAMYRAKQRGRACIDVFDATLRAARSRRLEVVDRLRRGVADHQIDVHYQPIADFETGRTIGYEALARWTDQELGPVAPDEFIPVAEDHGLIVALGRDVLLRSCHQAAAWSGPAGGPAPAMSVNISAHQLCDPRLPADVLAALASTGIDPVRLCLEVTESVFMDDITASIAVLHALRAAGVRLVIDDFGTGYSSLSYLRRLPVDGLKIDRSFVAELGHAAEDDAIVDAIIQLGHSLGLTITAEGVETPEQAAILRGMGCDKAQGYLYGRPGPAEDVSPSTTDAASATNLPSKRAEERPAQAS